VYHGVALYPTYTMVRGGLFLVAATFWVLYFHEILFRSGKIRTQWLKKRLAELALLLFIALVSSLFFLFLSGIQFSRHR
jgi:hypothetical protein